MHLCLQEGRADNLLVIVKQKREKSVKEREITRKCNNAKAVKIARNPRHNLYGLMVQ